MPATIQAQATVKSDGFHSACPLCGNAAFARRGLGRRGPKVTIRCKHLTGFDAPRGVFHFASTDRECPGGCGALVPVGYRCSCLDY